MPPATDEFCNYLLRQIEKKDEKIYDLQYELETLLKSDDELLHEASHRIEELRSTCDELIQALKTSLAHLENFHSI